MVCFFNETYDVDANNLSFLSLKGRSSMFCLFIFQCLKFTALTCLLISLSVVVLGSFYYFGNF